ncbi:TPA: hypothetical protein ACFOVJ_001054 [Neisseria meningitidis]|uniref:Uncharacterized protein n=1 Tax=Neisseria meningitidis TaxID=487 RepID=A0A425B241_NEIME|nr:MULTISPECIES: hypothetical protein [Neisseria]ADO31490.1 hypothetical protein NMBB_1135 [Neisseria meningitidis alpha710]ANW94023.1 hypothetical protein WUE2121_1389 [Neisseria meningitidis]EQD23373.1 hypothetical protein NM3230_2205 [Neisseria meningitidis NM3230]MBG8664222.1 hypothetical protein [Neisseria meningitidis]MBG8712075.1 hypothetical protein [Neisseria meningitidis]
MKLKKWQKRAIKHGIVTVQDWEKLKAQTYAAGVKMAENAEQHGGIAKVNREILKELKRLNRLHFGKIPKEFKPKLRELESKLKDLD